MGAPHNKYRMRAWAKTLDSDQSSGIRFLGDPAGDFTRAWDVEFNAAKLMGNNRSKRYAVVTEDGKVKAAYVELDNTGVKGELFFSFFFSRDFSRIPKNW